MSSKFFVAKAPSNIAFLKYWGKLDEEAKWPTNNSLSMTLKNSQSSTSSSVRPKLNGFVLYREGKQITEGSFYQKVNCHLNFLKKEFSFKPYLEVKTSNNFPTASGIASSASGFAALTLSALAAWTDSSSFEKLEEKGFSRQKLASLARLGSGSACRSFHGGFVLWEKGKDPKEQQVSSLASDWKLADTLVILTQEEKKLSSREAHSRVPSSPFFPVRLSGILQRQKNFEEAIKDKNFSRLGELLELEALEIHSIIMTAVEPFSYLSKDTVTFLSWLRKIRSEGLVEVYFTIDAGSNVHVISRADDLNIFTSLLEKDYPHLSYIKDSVGSGPEIFCIEE